MDGIFEEVSGLLNDGLEEDMAGSLRVVGRGRSQAAGVVISGEHKRGADAAVDASLGACYEGSFGGDTEYSFETVFHQGNSTDVNCSISNLLGMAADSFSYSAEISHAEGNQVSHTCEWSRDSDGITSGVKLERPTPSSGLLVEPSLVVSQDGTTLGGMLRYDGGAARLVKAAFALSQRVRDVTLAFTAGLDREDGPKYSFDCGFNYLASDKLQAGGTLSRTSQSPIEIALGGRYELEPGVSLTAKATTAGLYAVAWSVLISSHLTATLLLQHRTHSGSPGGGLTLSYDNTEDEVEADDMD
eukprot:TRINITY_DN20450_c0_g1_i1.p1 TRINITY_DN20450_c0_g1~~TRINITY_DN20450_c0_g1_i1.p1  ORF type:complete len:301 (+),score=113.74 TRINITY_DN20450_c0_g1_i1:42-944(+)